MCCNVLWDMKIRLTQAFLVHFEQYLSSHKTHDFYKTHGSIFPKTQGLFLPKLGWLWSKLVEFFKNSRKIPQKLRVKPSKLKVKPPSTRRFPWIYVYCQKTLKKAWLTLPTIPPYVPFSYCGSHDLSSWILNLKLSFWANVFTMSTSMPNILLSERLNMPYGVNGTIETFRALPYNRPLPLQHSICREDVLIPNSKNYFLLSQPFSLKQDPTYSWVI